MLNWFIRLAPFICTIFAFLAGYFIGKPQYPPLGWFMPFGFGSLVLTLHIALNYYEGVKSA